MKNIFFYILCLILIFLIFYDSFDLTKENLTKENLTKENITKENFTNNVNVYYFNAEWCGHCKQFKPIWTDFCNSLKPTDNIITKNVNCESNKDLCSKFNIEGYPTVIIEKDNQIIPYSGPRTVKGLRSALNLSIQSNNNKIKIFNFNTEWCGYSKKFQPIWNTFANSIIEADNIEAINVNCDDNKELCKKYNIPGYPTVVIENNDTVKIYDGPRTVEGLKNATKSFN